MSSSSDPANSKGTEYTILHALPRESATDSDKWEEFDTVTAKSADEAIRLSTAAAGTYVAVPSRSWRPRKVTVESKPVVRLESA